MALNSALPVPSSRRELDSEPDESVSDIPHRPSSGSLQDFVISRPDKSSIFRIRSMIRVHIGDCFLTYHVFL